MIERIDKDPICNRCNKKAEYWFEQPRFIGYSGYGFLCAQHKLVVTKSWGLK